MKSHFAFLLVVAAISTRAVVAEPPALTFVIHGRGPVTSPDDMNRPELIETVLFQGEAVRVTLSVVNPPEAQMATWASRVRWTVQRPGQAEELVSSVADLTSAPKAPLAHLMNRAARHLNYNLVELPPGRYIVRARLDDSVTHTLKLLTIYRGDENAAVRSIFFREQARSVGMPGSPESYRAARDLFLRAAEGSGDPSIYEELADLSAPWAQPDETTSYYLRALDIARSNLEKRFGPRPGWPARAERLYRPQETKAQTFKSLVPYYRNHFDEVRVFVTSEGFVIRRRSDDGTIRVVPLR